MKPDPLSVVSRLRTKLHSLWLRSCYPFPAMGRNVSIHYSCQIDRENANRIRFGSNVYVAPDVWFNVLPGKQDTAVIIEDGCKIGRRSMISAKNSIHIGRDVLISPAALIMDHNHGFSDVTRAIHTQDVTEGGTIYLDSGCWLGYNAVVLCNRGELVIGRNSVVGANSVVTSSVPPLCVVCGNPARVVRRFDDAEGLWRHVNHESPDRYMEVSCR